MATQRSGESKALVTLVRTALRAEANPEKAAPMAAYMKTEMPFYGVQKPGRVKILREALRAHPITNRAAYRHAVEALWSLPHREEKYLAIQLAIHEARYITHASIPMYERMIREGAWWDFVDDLAIRLVGHVLRHDRERLQPRIVAFIDDDDMWIRRTAIICQIKHTDDTDEAWLFEACRRRAHEKEFFIRKAIGWALRAHAYTNPAAVRRFLHQHRKALSGLSFREASKHLSM